MCPHLRQQGRQGFCLLWFITVAKYDLRVKDTVACLDDDLRSSLLWEITYENSDCYLLLKKCSQREFLMNI